MARSVSVIIPAYNAAKFLSDAVESVHRQQYGPLEIVIVDDGSIDNTAELATRFPGVRCIRLNHAGPAAARNAGIEASQGEMLAFLDADDLWVEGKLHMQLAMLDSNPDLQLVAGRVEEFYAEGTPHIADREKRQSGNRAYTLGALLVRRRDFLRVGVFDRRLNFGEFLDWRSRAMALGYKEQVLDQVVLRRRIHEDNMTRLAKGHQAHYLATVRAHLLRRRASSEGEKHDVQ